MCLSPALTEVLFAVGAGPRVVAVTTTDDYPPEVKSLPTVGGFAPETISTEAILAQKPDLLLAGGRFQKPIVEALAKFGVPGLVIDSGNLDQVQESIGLVGRLVGQETEAGRLVDDFRGRLEAVRARSARIPEKERVKVLYVLWDEPLQTMGPATFVGQMITAAGGVNVFTDASQAYPRVSDEAVLAWDPDVILAPDHGSKLPQRLSRRPGWSRLKAIKAGRVVSLPGDLLNRPGPRLVEGLQAIENALKEVRDGR